MKSFRIPINLKIIALVTLLIAGPISFLTYKSIELQKKTVMASAYDRQSLEVKLINERVFSLIKNGNNTLKAVMMNDQSVPEEFKVHGETVFKNQQEIQSLYVWEMELEKRDDPRLLFEVSAQPEVTSALLEELAESLPEVLKNHKTVVGFNVGNEQYLGMFLADVTDANKTIISGAVIPFKVSNISNIVVLNNHQVIYQSDLTWENVLTNPWVQKGITESINNSSGEYLWNKESYLGSFSKNNSLVTVIFNPLDKILISVYDLIQKIMVASLLVFSGGIALAIAFSRKMFGSPLEDLTAITRKIGLGNFNVEIKNKPNDELGDLGRGFEQMSSKILGLLKDQEQKIKLENEVNLAATIHKTILPEKEFENEWVKIKNVSIAASQFGGDIFDYYVFGNKLVLMIADATGHGLNSALATTAVKGAISSSLEFKLLHNQGDVSLEDVMQRANLAVFNNSKGQVMMTMFLAIIDRDQKTITYANAGHNPPWLFKKTGKVESLSLPSNRLGEKNSLNEVQSRVLSFDETDVLFMYTDGLTETMNMEGVEFNKKQVRKLLQENLFVKGSDASFKNLLSTFNRFIQGKKYPDDDVSIMMVELKDTKSQGKAA